MFLECLATVAPCMDIFFENVFNTMVTFVHNKTVSITVIFQLITMSERYIKDKVKTSEKNIIEAEIIPATCAASSKISLCIEAGFLFVNSW